MFYLKIEYKLIGIITAPKINHHNIIIFNPMGLINNINLSLNNIYYRGEMLNDGCIISLKKGENWKNIGIPYILCIKN